MLPQGDITGPSSRGLVFPEGDIANPQMSNEATDVGFCHFSGAVRAYSRAFPPTSEENPRRDTTGSDSRRAPEAWCSWTGTLQAQISTQVLTLLSNTPQPKWCYSCSPHSFFPPWSPSLFAVDDVSYSCAEQCMMAQKARLYKYYRAVELIVSLLDPSTHKRSRCAQF